LEAQALFDNIGAENVKMFLLKQTLDYEYFLSSCQCPASPAVDPSG